MRPQNLPGSRDVLERRQKNIVKVEKSAHDRRKQSSKVSRLMEITAVMTERTS